VVILCHFKAGAQEFETTKKQNIPAVQDTITSPQDSLAVDLSQIEISIQDSIPKDSVKTKKRGRLEHNIIQSAETRIRNNLKEQKVYLYNKAKIEYGDMRLEAGQIILNNRKREVYAYGITDSTGNYTQRPVFTQGGQKVEPDSIRFHIDTRKALVYNSRTEQGEIRVIGEVTKRENDSVYFISRAKFTTAEDLDNPEYYFLARKVKFVPGKKVVSGLVNMYIADVPTPLGLPFGYFPMTTTRSSGFIIPSIGNDRNRGYSLQNGGYYFAINDYVDLTTLADYYTNGSYGLRLESSYAWRYRFTGNFNFRYERLLISERGFPDFSESSIYNLRWHHQQDPKSNPTSRFSASVNLGSSKYYRESLNEMNSGNFLNNNLSSSISYSKTFPGDPEFRLSVTATHNQNTNTEEINMTLPTLNASMSRIYPFAPKSGTKKGIIENINFQYDVRGENRFKTTDSLFFKPEMFRDIKSGIQHKIPISTNFKIFNHFSVSAGANYQETWVFDTYKQSYNPKEKQVVIDTMRGFDSYRTYNFNTSVGTTVYGMFKFGKQSRIDAIRHVMKPSVSYTLTPSFDDFYDTYLIPATSGADERLVEYSRFERTLFGAPSKNYASSLGFSLTNDFEAKIRSKDSLGKTEKRKLLKNLRFSTNYNMAADSLKFQPITFGGTLPLFKEKLNINFNGALDPYALDNRNQRIDKLNINNGGSLFRLTRGNISFDYSFSNADFGGREKPLEDSETFKSGGRRDNLFGESMNRDGTFGNKEERDKEKKKEEKSDLYHFKIPWNLRVSYTMTYNNARRENEISSHSIMFSGDAEIAPRWSVGVSSGYDLKNKGFTYTQFRFERDLQSWRMSFNWTPFGVRESWYFFIGIKANVLEAIKFDKRRAADRVI